MRTAEWLDAIDETNALAATIEFSRHGLVQQADPLDAAGVAFEDADPVRGFVSWPGKRNFNVKIKWTKVRRTALVLVAALTITLASPISASASESDQSVPEVQLTAQQVTDVNAIAAASDAETNTFDVAEASKLGATDQAVADAATMLTSNGWTIDGSPTMTASDEALDIAAIATSCAGISGYTGYWWPWGHQLALDSCQTSQLIAAVFAGAGAAGVVTAVLIAAGATAIAAPIAGIVAAVLTFGGAALQLCSAASAPKYAIYLNVLGSPAVSCWGQ